MQNLTESKAPDFSTIFAQVDAAGFVDLVKVTRQISEQAETIEMIAQATDRTETAYVVTFLSN
jgi:hypothetical protein